MAQHLLLLLALLCLPTPSARAQGLCAEQESALLDIAQGCSTPWLPLDAAQVQALHDRAETYWMRYEANHLPHGFNADIIWCDPERSCVASYKGLGDGAIWTGHYLAALALRYAVEPDEALRLAILRTLDDFDLLTRVSGRDGYIARYAGPADGPAYRAYYQQSGGEDPGRPGLGRHAYAGAPPYEDLVWIGDSSRDTYDGFVFGCAALWAFVEADEILARVKALVERVGTRLAADNFWIFDGKGDFTWPSLQWGLTCQRLLLTVCPETFSHLQLRYWINYIFFRIYGLHLRPIWERKYYPNNLDMIRMFTLCLLEPHEGLQTAYVNVLRRAYQSKLAHHLNAHFAAIYLLCTEDEDAAAIATLQGTLLDFPAEKWGYEVDQRDRDDIEMRNEDYAPHALLVRDRPMRDFLWQRPPALTHGGVDLPLEYPGIDLFLPYWMGRAAEVIPAP